MQSSASEAVDLSKESEATKKLYGMDDPATSVYGTNCLMARKLVERGVRFIELYCGSGSGWDAHNNIEANHSKWCRASDKPIAGLLTDLKARGMLKDTLVVWGGEFGRTPFNEAGDGRDHNPWGFTVWMAGGGEGRPVLWVDRRDRPARRRASGARSRHSCHDSPPARAEPPAAHVYAQWTRGASDGVGRRSGQGDFFVTSKFPRQGQGSQERLTVNGYGIWIVRLLSVLAVDWIGLAV